MKETPKNNLKMKAQDRPPADRTEEAMKFREELERENSVEADAGLAALDGLARVSEKEGEVEVPPVPEDLRSQWQDRFGMERSREDVVERVSFFDRMMSWWRGPRAYGAAAGMALVVVFLVARTGNETGGGGATGDENGGVVLRGAEDFEPGDEVALVLIPARDLTFEMFEATRAGGSLYEAGDREGALALIADKGLKAAVVVDAATGEVFPWKGGAGEVVDLFEEEFDEFELSVAVDDYLKLQRE